MEAGRGGRGLRDQHDLRGPRRRRTGGGEGVLAGLIFDRKKRYIGRTFMHPDKPPKIDCKGVELVRRDNSQFLRDTYKAAVDAMMPPTGLALTKAEVLKAIREKVKEALTSSGPRWVHKFSITKSKRRTRTPTSCTSSLPRRSVPAS